MGKLQANRDSSAARKPRAVYFGFTKKDRAAVPPVPHADTPLLTWTPLRRTPAHCCPVAAAKPFGAAPSRKLDYPRGAKGGTPQPTRPP
jgi:hypothetical protein